MQLALQHTYRRLQTLRTHRITALPVAILMPHSSCNCRCVMCDIWKGNARKNQLTEDDIAGLLLSFKKLGTRQVVMSGGEALLNEHFFRFCSLLSAQGIKITLLSTGLLLKKYAGEIVANIADVIVSLDGDEQTHDAIRNIEGAYARMKEGVQHLKKLKPSLPVSGRSVIQRMNFRNWPLIVESAKEIGLNSISFLPADVSSEAFNREQPWDAGHVSAVAIQEEELPELYEVIAGLVKDHAMDFQNHFIAESPSKLSQVYTHYAAIHGLCDFPSHKCNAPWVSVVVEADGNVKPCFFHNSIGNIRGERMETILNGEAGLAFRRSLNMEKDPVCTRCVCSLNLPFHQNPGR
jgi:MoaA/NifB/PqqE/SkfB family radical SAM enzyme